jgi:hypothetical protein
MNDLITQFIVAATANLLKRGVANSLWESGRWCMPGGFIVSRVKTAALDLMVSYTTLPSC